MRVVGGNFPGEIARTLARLVEARAVLARRGFDRRAHRLGVEQGIDDGAPVRKVRADDLGADAAKMRAQHARNLAQRALDRNVALAIERFAHMHGRGELDDRRASVEQQREQAAEAAQAAPVAPLGAPAAPVPVYGSGGIGFPLPKRPRQPPVQFYTPPWQIDAAGGIESQEAIGQPRISVSLAIASIRSKEQVGAARIRPGVIRNDEEFLMIA